MRVNFQSSYVFPASSDQERLWFLQQFDNRLGAAYNISTAFKIRTAINRVAMQKAVNYLVQRHESLRTSLRVVDSSLKQIIKTNLTVTINYHDYSQQERQDTESFILAIMNTEARNPFDLSEDTLFKIVLYQIKHDEYYLLIILHHSIADGVSLEVFINELFLSYSAYVEKKDPVLPEIQYQFADIVNWMNNSLTAEDYTAHTCYWQKQLEGATHNIELPIDKLRPIEPAYEGNIIPFEFNSEINASVKKAAKIAYTTTNVVLLSAFALLIYQYTDEKDLLIGVPVANRYDEEMQSVIGFLANTVIIRVKISEKLTIRQLLKEVHKTVSETIRHQQLPYSKVVEIIKPDRKANVNSIFQLMFGYQEMTPVNLLSSSLPTERLIINNGLSRLDLSIFLIDEYQKISGLVEYSSEIFSIEKIKKFIDDYFYLCKSIEKEIETTIDSIDFSSILHDFKKNYNADFKTIKNIENKKQERFDNQNAFAVSDTEKRIETIWKNLLSIDRTISINENFFDLGGNSFLVARLVDEIKSDLNVLVSMKTIFLAPTIADLCKNVELLKSNNSGYTNAKLDQFISEEEQKLLKECLEI